MSSKGSLRWGRVAAIHPEDYALDLVMTDNGEQISGVQVLSPWASTSSGKAMLIEPSKASNGNAWDLTQTKPTDVLAGVAYFGTMPVVIGFRYPQICQMLFRDLQRMIDRHPSDFYTSIDSQANFEAYHPSGTYFRVGSSPAHEDLTGKDVDGNWKIAKNTASAPWVNLTVANAGSVVANIQVDPQGNINVQANGNLTGDITGNVSATIGGSVTANVTGNVDVTSPKTTIHGPLHVTGPITSDETIAATGAISTQATVAATGDITSGSISVLKHFHTAQGANAQTTVAQD